MLIGIFKHGGRTRRMLTLEVGRADKRAVKVYSQAEALRIVREWLEEAERKIARKQGGLPMDANNPQSAGYAETERVLDALEKHIGVEWFLARKSPVAPGELVFYIYRDQSEAYAAGATLREAVLNALDRDSRIGSMVVPSPVAESDGPKAGSDTPESPTGL